MRLSVAGASRPSRATGRLAAYRESSLGSPLAGQATALPADSKGRQVPNEQEKEQDAGAHIGSRPEGRGSRGFFTKEAPSLFPTISSTSPQSTAPPPRRFVSSPHCSCQTLSLPLPPPPPMTTYQRFWHGRTKTGEYVAHSKPRCLQPINVPVGARADLFV